MTSPNLASLTNYGGSFHDSKTVGMSNLEAVMNMPAVAKDRQFSLKEVHQQSEASSAMRPVATRSTAQMGSERDDNGASPGTISDDGLSNALFTQIALEDRLCINNRDEMKDLQNRQLELERRFVELECQFQGLAEESLSRLGHIDLFTSVGVVERLGAMEMREKKLVAYVNKALTGALAAGSRSHTPLQQKSLSPSRETPTSVGETAQDVAELAAKIRDQDDELLMLQDQFKEMQEWCTTMSKRFDKDCRENGKVGDLGAWPLETHTKGDFTELRRQVSTLQDEVNQRLFELSRQVLETGQRTQTLNTQCQEFSTKVESHEVSFNATLSRLEAVDTKVAWLTGSMEDMMASGHKPVIMGPGACTSLLAIQAEAIDAQKEAIDVLQRQMGIQAMPANEDGTGQVAVAVPHLYVETIQNSDGVEAIQCTTLPQIRVQNREDLAVGHSATTAFTNSDSPPRTLAESMREKLQGLRQDAMPLRTTSPPLGARETSPPSSTRLRVASPVTMKAVRSHSPMPPGSSPRHLSSTALPVESGERRVVLPRADIHSHEANTTTRRELVETRSSAAQEFRAGATAHSVPVDAELVTASSSSNGELNFDDLELTISRLRKKWVEPPQ